MAPEAPIIWENPKAKGSVWTTDLSDGGVEAGFKENDQIIEFDLALSFGSSHSENPARGVIWCRTAGTAARDKIWL